MQGEGELDYTSQGVIMSADQVIYLESHLVGATSMDNLCQQDEVSEQHDKNQEAR